MLVDGGTLDGRQVFKPATVKMMWTRTAGRQRQPRARLGRVVGLRAIHDAVLPDRVDDPHRVHRHLRDDRPGLRSLPGAADQSRPPQRGRRREDPRSARARGGRGRGHALHLRRTAAGAGRVRSRRPPTGRRSRGVTVEPSVGAPLGPAVAAPTLPSVAPRSGPVLTGLDVLVRQNFAPFAGYSVGLVTNHTGVDARGLRNIDLLYSAPGVRLEAIFTPEHGLGGHRRHRRPEQSRRRHRRADLEPVRQRPGGRAPRRCAASRCSSSTSRTSGCGTTPT